MQKTAIAGGHLNRQALPYTACYCEENVYMLCKQFEQSKQPDEKGFAIVLTNELQQTSVRQQKSSKDAADNYRVRWDYHVIFIARLGKDVRVYDHDTRLEWGAPFADYYDRSLKTEPGQLKTLFRVVPSKVYLETFSSDRSHMIKIVNGVKRYAQPPPNYPPIKNSKEVATNLNEYLNCENRNPQFGVLLKAEDFYKYFS